jgi:hypothetical protein
MIVRRLALPAKLLSTGNWLPATHFSFLETS